MFLKLIKFRLVSIKLISADNVEEINMTPEYK